MKKSLYCKFKETSLSVDASVACDQMKELEKTVDYEAFMRECLACESVYTTKTFEFGNPWIAGWFVRFGGTNGFDPCGGDVVDESHA